MSQPVVYPARHFRPEDWLGFFELPVFTRYWSKLGLTDEDLLLVQLGIMCQPKAAPVIEGTGGLRKLRFSPHSRPTGKRDAHRLCYVYFEEVSRVLLVLVYPKNQKDDLSAAERTRIREMIEQIRKEWF